MEPIEESKALDEIETLRLSAEDQARFVDVLVNPPSIAPALGLAKDAHDNCLGRLTFGDGGVLLRSFYVLA